MKELKTYRRIRNGCLTFFLTQAVVSFLAMLGIDELMNYAEYYICVLLFIGLIFANLFSWYMAIRIDNNYQRIVRKIDNE